MTLLKDEVFTLVQELSSTGLSAALVGLPNRSSEGSKSSDLLKTLEQTKSSEECDPNNPTGDIKDRGYEESGIFQDNYAKKQRYSSMSAEVCFTRDRPILQKKMANKMDVTYVNVTQKIKSSCLLMVVDSCVRLSYNFTDNFTLTKPLQQCSFRQNVFNKTAKDMAKLKYGRDPAMKTHVYYNAE